MWKTESKRRAEAAAAKKLPRPAGAAGQLHVRRDSPASALPHEDDNDGDERNHLTSRSITRASEDENGSD